MSITIIATTAKNKKQFVLTHDRVRYDLLLKLNHPLFYISTWNRIIIAVQPELLKMNSKLFFIECLYLNTIEQLFHFVKGLAFRPQFLQFLSSLRLLKLMGIQIKTSSLNFNMLLMHNFT